MTDVDIDAIQARADDSTEGPWEAYEHSNSMIIYSVDENDSVVAQVTRITDATFIAHARTDIPALIAEVKDLRAQLRGGERKSTDSRTEGASE
jgi:hypothetical protein